MDTGADSSLIMPTAAGYLGIDYSQLRGDEPSIGLGGRTSTFAEDAILVFAEPAVAIYVYRLQIGILPQDPAMEGAPSLLGRDILDRWRITYDPLGVGLRAKVRSFDRMIDLKTG